MKRIICMVAVFVTAVFLSSPARADDGTFSFGMYMSATAQDQSLKQVFNDLVDYLAQEQEVEVRFMWYIDEKEFLKAAGNRELDFIYTKNYSLLPELIGRDKYVPFASASLFGKKKMKSCLFTRNDVEISGIEDMRGMSLITYDEADGYYPLIEMTGEKPEDFFGGISLSQTGQISLKRLLAGEADLVLAYNMNILALKMANPSILKEIKELYCAHEFYNAPIMHSGNVSEDIMEGLLDILKTGAKHEALKMYRPMMMATDIRFFPVKKDAYDSVLEVFARAEEQEWDKDFKRWIAGFD